MNPVNIIGLILNGAAVYFVNTPSGKNLVKSGLVRTLVTIGGIGASAFFTVKLAKELKEASDAKKWQGQQVPGYNTGVPGYLPPQQGGQPPADGSGLPGIVTPTVDLKTVAGQIDDAFYQGWDLFGWYSNDDQAINAVQSINPNYAPNLAQVYFQLFARPLKADLVKHLSVDEQARLKAWMDLM